jgi:NAD(P)-dependent dehydrogenase (short-subunit alcohol dehydrogenase family)
MEYNPFTLKDKVILVTGASSGIGRSTSIECSRMGATMIITGRNEVRLKETYDSLEGAGHKQIVADFSSETGLNALSEYVTSIDGVVYCAGFTKPLPIQFINEEDISEIMKVNFIAPTLISRNLLQNKKIRKGASIVFISSISGVYCSYVAQGLYAASKGAINGLIKSMALELATKNIRVNSICPGMINTNILESGIISREQLEEDIKKYPLKRYGQPQEVAYAAIYLLSDASQWVTGSNLLIDGGYTLL